MKSGGPSFSHVEHMWVTARLISLESVISVSKQTVLSWKRFPKSLSSCDTPTPWVRIVSWERLCWHVIIDWHLSWHVPFVQVAYGFLNGIFLLLRSTASNYWQLANENIVILEFLFDDTHYDEYFDAILNTDMSDSFI